MPREQHLVETFVTLADTMVAEYDVIDFLQILAEQCVELLDVTAAGIMLAEPGGQLRHAACSSEEMRLVELLEIQIAQGPCFDAYRDQVSVSSESPSDAARRWPMFAEIATEHGFKTMSAVPMRLRGEALGALNLFSTESRGLTDADMRVAQGMADIATIGVLQERAISSANAISSQLVKALESRIVIEQAKGIVAEHDHLTVDEAFEIIRSYARSRNRLLSEVAREIRDAVHPSGCARDCSGADGDVEHTGRPRLPPAEAQRSRTSTSRIKRRRPLTFLIATRNARDWAGNSTRASTPGVDGPTTSTSGLDSSASAAWGSGIRVVATARSMIFRVG